jgi:hypothetical protein
VANRPIYIALAVTAEGRRDILGLWAGEAPSVTGAPGGEGAKYWLHVLTEIKNRGVGDVLMVVCDGLTGLPDAISTVWPQTITQTCVVHYADLRIMPTWARSCWWGRCCPWRGRHNPVALPARRTLAGRRYRRGDAGGRMVLTHAFCHLSWQDRDRSCGVPEVGPGSLTSGDRWSDMIPACRCGCST